MAFETPFDAEGAIGVCGVPLPAGLPDPDALVWFGGWYAFPVVATDELSISFPATGRPPMDVTVRVFDAAGHLEQSFETTLADTGALEVPAARGGWSRWLFGG